MSKSYTEASKNFEQIFEDDMRLFLFEQGIDYPFSTPKSSSGRADVISNIDTNDPIIVEIKILDKKRNYGKNRIKGGFSQIVSYSNDYNKSVGYLVIFNMNNETINFKLNDGTITTTPVINFNSKVYYVIVIDLVSEKSASKKGVLQEITVLESELTRE